MLGIAFHYSVSVTQEKEKKLIRYKLCIYVNTHTVAYCKMTVSFSLIKHDCTVSRRSAGIRQGEKEGKGGRRKKRGGIVPALRKGGVRHRERAAGAPHFKSSLPEKLFITVFTVINI